MSSSTKLNVDSSRVKVSPTLYRSIIGSLLYLTASKPDIAFSVGVCARDQATPKESHLTAVKRIIWYINGTPDYGLWYSKDSNACFTRYLDADFAGSVDDRKSTSRGCFYLGNNLVSWMSKKKNFVSLSTTKVEYIATRSCYTQLLWMKKLLHDCGIPQDTMCVFCDNTSAINLSKNPVQQSKSKNIEIHYHFIRDLGEERVVCLEFIHTENQKADIFTKPLDGPRFESLCKTLVLVQSLESLVWCVLHLFILCYFVCGSHTSFYWLLIASSIFAIFTLLLLINLFILMCQKSKNHIKSRKSKVWWTVLSFVSKLVLPCTFVLMALCIYERSLFPCTLITVEEILKSMWLL